METYHWNPPFLLEYLGFLVERAEGEVGRDGVQCAVRGSPFPSACCVVSWAWPHSLCGLSGVSPIVQMEKLREVKQFAQGCPAAKQWI